MQAGQTPSSKALSLPQSAARPWAHKDEQDIHEVLSQSSLDGWMKNGENGNQEGKEPTGRWRGDTHAEEKCDSS